MGSLQSERQASIHKLLSTTTRSRPLLTHINNDTSWLLSLPIPKSYQASRQDSRIYFHILIDPWLTPSNSIAPWFLQQYHVDVPACTTISAVEELINTIEAASGKFTDGSRGEIIDAIVTNHTNTDHTNKETLLQVDPSVPVYSRFDSAKMIKSWKHFDQVYTIPSFGKEGALDWRTSSEGNLPEWLSFWHLGWKEGFPALHFGLMITWENSGHKDGEGECLVLSPHGIFVDDIKIIGDAKPAIRPLAILHTMKETWSWPFGTANLGAIHGLKVMREAKPKYWIPTHDELVTSTGGYSWFLREREITVEEALKQEESEKKEERQTKGFEFAVVGNGESFVLA